MSYDAYGDVAYCLSCCLSDTTNVRNERSDFQNPLDHIGTLAI